MKIINSFIEEGKNKALKNIISIEKGFDYYLGIVIDKINNEEDIQNSCKLIYEKSLKNIKLLDICKIDEKDFLIFELNSEFTNNINGILKSISKYLGVPEYTVTYMKSLYNMVFDTWGEQFYFNIVNKDKTIDLRTIKE